MLKFSLVLSAAILVTIVALGLVVFGRIKKELEEDIKQQGAMGVTVLSSLGAEIIQSRKSTDPIIVFLDKLPSHLESQLENPKAPAARETTKKLRKLVAKITAKHKANRSLIIQSGLSGLLSYSGSIPVDQGVVIDANLSRTDATGQEFLVMSAKKGDYNFKSRGLPITLELKTPQGDFKMKNIFFLKGHYRRGNGPPSVAYQFSREIRDIRGRLLGRAHLTLSSLRMEQIASRMNSFLLLAGAIAIVAGVIISFFLSALVNRPIKQLLNDIRIVAQGRLDHRALVRSDDEVGLLARTFNQMTQSLKVAHEAEIENEVIRRDLKVASEVQAHLVPQEMPKVPGLDLTARYEPAREVGGDAFDIIPLPSGRLGLVIADVSGKGVSGALYMAMTRVAFRVATKEDKSPQEIVSIVHQMIAPELTKGRFITGVYMEVDVDASKVTCCRLGHNPILHYSHQQNEIREYTPKGFAIGLVNSEVFSMKLEIEEFDVHPGDRVLLYTDGITEAANSRDEEFGEERLNEFLNDNAGLTSDQFVDSLIQQVKLFIEDRPLLDDLTVVSIALPVAGGSEAEAEAKMPSETALE